MPPPSKPSPLNPHAAVFIHKTPTQNPDPTCIFPPPLHHSPFFTTPIPCADPAKAQKLRDLDAETAFQRSEAFYNETSHPAPCRCGFNEHGNRVKAHTAERYRRVLEGVGGVEKERRSEVVQEERVGEEEKEKKEEQEKPDPATSPITTMPEAWWTAPTTHSPHSITEPILSVRDIYHPRMTLAFAKGYLKRLAVRRCTEQERRLVVADARVRWETGVWLKRVCSDRPVWEEVVPGFGVERMGWDYPDVEIGAEDEVLPSEDLDVGDSEADGVAGSEGFESEYTSEEDCESEEGYTSEEEPETKDDLPKSDQDDIPVLSANFAALITNACQLQHRLTVNQQELLDVETTSIQHHLRQEHQTTNIQLYNDMTCDFDFDSNSETQDHECQDIECEGQHTHAPAFHQTLWFRALVMMTMLVLDVVESLLLKNSGGVLQGYSIYLMPLFMSLICFFSAD